jgi:dGTPase
MIASDQRNGRFRPETLSGRDAEQIDRDRILYCPHFARLADVTQVRTMDGDYLVHNRLTHSLKVGQLARRMTEKLLKDETDQGKLAKEWKLNPEVAEAAGLAHDLGHPPFGHIAEEELNELVGMTTGEGYEGNAQSFRIVTRLGVSDVSPVRLAGSSLQEQRSPGAQGLNLTKATLNAILKYPWRYGENAEKKNKWGAYHTETAYFDWTRENLPAQQRSPEAEIMDWADDITYAIHDLIDFFCAGLIPLHLLARGAAEREWANFFSRARARKEKFSDSAYEKALDGARSTFPEEAYDGSQVHTQRLWQIITILIKPLVDALKLTDPTQNGGRYTSVEKDKSDLVAILQELTWAYVIQRPDLAMIQYAQRKMIRRLFKIHLKNAQNNNWSMFPAGFAEYVGTRPGTPHARHVADHISGLSERQIERIHGKLIGGT